MANCILLLIGAKLRGTGNIWVSAEVDSSTYTKRHKSNKCEGLVGKLFSVKGYKAMTSHFHMIRVIT
jgi:hypothetical protein